MEEQIIELLEENTIVELETERSVLIIMHKAFRQTRKEYLFQLNGSPIYGCTGRKTALNKIKSFLDKGFVMS